MIKNVVGRVAMALVAATALQACGVDDGSLDETESVEQDVALPPPTGLTVTVVSTTQMNLAWNAVTGAAKYIVLRGSASGNETSYTTDYATTLVAGHLATNTNYCWEVKAVAANGISSGPSNEVCASTGTAPVIPPPSNITVTATSSSRITVAWTAVTGATKYTIYQGIGAATPTLLTSVASPAVTYNIAGLTASTQYCYTLQTVTATDSSVQSSPPVCARTFSAGLEAYYRFEERGGTTSADSSGFNRNLALTGSTLPFSNKPPIADDLSYLSVTSTATSVASTPNVGAFRLNGSDFSLVMWVNTPVAGDAVILGMKPATCGANGWMLSQDAVNKLAFRGENGIRSFGSSLAANTWTHVGVVLLGTTMHLYLNGVEVASGSYTKGNHLTTEPLSFGHAGGCAGGAVLIDEAQVYSRALSAAEVATFGKIPPVPTGISAVANASTKATVTWTDAVTTTKDLVYQGTTSGAETFITSIHATTYVNGHLMPSTPYFWYVRSVANNLISNPSAEATATTPAGPAAPTNVVATASGTSRINVTWTAVTGATKYYLYQSTDNVTFTFKASGSTTALSATALTTMTKYYYYVIAEDAGLALSPHSATVSATTN